MSSDPPVATKPSLRTELLINIAVLAGGALVLAVGSALLTPLFGQRDLGAVFLITLIALDLLIFIAFGRYLVSRLITRPIDRLVDATEAVAAGELGRRAPPADTRELDALASSVNRMTERLLDAQGALIRAEKLASVGRLAAGVAHEVGNPLSAISNYAEVLRRRGGDIEVAGAIARESARIDTIVRGLLDYARPRDAVREPVNLEEVARGAVTLLTAQGVLRPVTVDLETAQAPRTRGDRAALEQVIVNLILNAVDAVGEGGRILVAVSPTTVGAEPQPRRITDPGQARAEGRSTARRSRHLSGVADGTRAVQVLVADNGPGVPDELAPRIFDPFFTTKDPGRGTGLGLAIVQRIVEDHGGRIDVSRSREGGAAFTVTLPPESAG